MNSTIKVKKTRVKPSPTISRENSGVEVSLGRVGEIRGSSQRSIKDNLTLNGIQYLYKR